MRKRMKKEEEVKRSKKKCWGREGKNEWGRRSCQGRRTMKGAMKTKRESRKGTLLLSSALSSWPIGSQGECNWRKKLRACHPPSTTQHTTRTWQGRQAHTRTDKDIQHSYAFLFFLGLAP
jgi:hypothetical protein